MSYHTTVATSSGLNKSDIRRVHGESRKTVFGWLSPDRRISMDGRGE
jgi:hypothetical protein